MYSAATLSRQLRLHVFFFSSSRRHTRLTCDWSSDVCSSDLEIAKGELGVLDTDDSATALAKVRVLGDAAPAIAHTIGLDDPDSPLVDLPPRAVIGEIRSEERRVGKEGGSGGARDH